jgi:hypothetical protein
LLGQAERRELQPIRAKRIGLDNLRARLDVGSVHSSNRVGLGQVEFLKAALRADGFVQQRSHRAIGDQNCVLQPLFEIVDLHSRFCSLIFLLAFAGL